MGCTDKVKDDNDADVNTCNLKHHLLVLVCNMSDSVNIRSRILQTDHTDAELSCCF